MVNYIDLSVIICTLNRGTLLRKCLESIVRQQSGSYSIETIVVDNGSTDDTKDVTESFRTYRQRLRYIVEPQPGLARARQTGFKASIGRYVAYLDDDAIADPHWCSTICKTFGQMEQLPNNRVAALGGPVEPMFEISRPVWLTGELTKLYAIVDRGNQLHPYPAADCPIGANMAFLRTVLRNNPWDCRLLMCEEIELFGRLAQNGFTFLYVPEMRVQHFISAKRLKPEWLMDRYLAEGLAQKSLPLGFSRKVHLTIAAIIKLIPCWALSTFGPRDQRLIFHCKVRFYHGFLVGLFGFRNLRSMAYLSGKQKTAF